MIRSRATSEEHSKEACVAVRGCREAIVLMEALSQSAKTDRKRAKRAGNSEQETGLVEALRRRDESAFLLVVERYHGAMLRVALPYVGTPQLAEEVAQEAWTALLSGIDRFEGRSSLRHWLFSILLKRARSIARREQRCIAASQTAFADAEEGWEGLDRLFHGQDHSEAGAWAVPPRRWKVSPEDRLLEGEVQRRVIEAIDRLPEAQRLVITLRDAEGWPTREVAELMNRDSNWVRVVLHRARLKIREVLSEDLEGVEP